MTEINPGDFIEIEFTGKTKAGELFDSNREKDAKILYKDAKVKPMILCVGQKMILPVIDDDFIKRKFGEHYTISIPCEKAFGKRNPSLVKTMPLKTFLDKKINPQPGMVFNIDGMLVKILSVSGGRVITDFNNPLSGKDIIYDLEIKRKVIDEKEKVSALFEFFINYAPEYEIMEKKIILPEKEKKLEPLLNLFKEKFKEIMGMEIEFSKSESLDKKVEKQEVKKEQKEDKKSSKSQNLQNNSA